MNDYANKYTWSHPYGDHCLAHTDGAVSCMISWQGVDVSTHDEQLTLGEYEQFYTLLHRFSEQYYYEFHWWREYDPTIADLYDQASERECRGGAFGRAVRDELSHHLRQFAMGNTLRIVITQPNKQGFFRSAKSALVKQGKTADELMAYVAKLIKGIPYARLCDTAEYQQRILQSFHRQKHLSGARPHYDPRFSLSEQIICERPALNRETATTKVGEVHTKTLYVNLYPDAGPGWFYGMSAIPSEMHVCAIVKPINTGDSIKKSERETDLTEGTAGRRGGAQRRSKLKHLSAFRDYVVDNQLMVFSNAYIIRLHNKNPDTLYDHARQLSEWIELAGGSVRSHDYMQLPWSRYAMPGQGYRCPRLRPDHTWQVGNMLPIQVPITGDVYMDNHEASGRKKGRQAVDSIRLRADGSLVGFNFIDAAIIHYLTSAMTRAGKGVDAVVTVAECYTQGIDFGIIEVGECYRWLVEAFGGTYTVADPEETAVNPLPSWRHADVTNTDDGPLSVHIVGSTATSLAYLVSDGKSLMLNGHQRAVLEPAIQALYLERPADATDDSAPLLPELHTSLEQLISLGEEAFSLPQLKEAKVMRDNLESFLSSQAGRVFEKKGTLVLSEGITGVDLGNIEKASPHLLKFYLIFISMRMLQNAMSSYRRSFIWLDEMHYFVKNQPEIVGQLCSEIVRMGGKKNAFLGIVTQELQELEMIEAAVINNIPMRNLLYRAGSHDEVIKRLNVPPGPARIFKGWTNPLGQPFRPGLRTTDTDSYHHLHLTFPQTLLALAESSPKALELKASIGKETRDPFERIERLANALYT